MAANYATLHCANEDSCSLVGNDVTVALECDGLRRWYKDDNDTLCKGCGEEMADD